MKKKVRLLLLIELLVTIVFIGMICINHSKDFEQIPVSLGDWISRDIEYSGTDWHVDGDQIQVNGGAVDLIYGPYIELPKGSYTVDIWYHCENSQSAELYANGGNTEFIKGDLFTLDKNYDHESYMFSTTENINNFEVQIKYNGIGSFTISDIQITKNNNGLYIALLWTLLVFAFIDGVLVYRTFSASEKFITWAVLGIGILSSLPLLYRGINLTEGQDLEFHLLRIDGIFRELRNGHFPVRIATVWNGGYGYATSVFYGDILLYFPAFLRLCGVSIYKAYKIYVFAMNLLSTAIAVFCFDKIFKDKRIASFVALVYMTASYRLVDVYVRSAVGEYSAILFTPLIGLAVWNIYAGENSSVKDNIKNGLILAIGMSGTITSHILTSEMTVVALLLVFVLLLKKSMSWNALRTYFVGVVGTLLLSAFFIVPFLDYYKNVPVEITAPAAMAIPKKVQTSGLALGEYFAFFNNPFGGDQYMLCTPGIILMGTLIVAVVIWIRGKASAQIKVLTICSTCMLFLASDIFPWNRLAYRFKVFNLLAQVQFPWRYVILAIIFQTLLLGCILREKALESALNINSAHVVKWSVVVSLLMICYFTSFYADNATRVKYYDTCELNTYACLSGEYLRIGEDGADTLHTDRNKFDGKFDAVNTEYLNVISRNGTDITIDCKVTGQDVTITAPLLNYKGYVVFDDNGNRYEIKDSDNYLVSFVVPADFEGNLHISFISPWYWTVAFVVSIASAIAIGGYFGLTNPLRNKIAEEP